jgi:anti-anti-sigma factor
MRIIQQKEDGRIVTVSPEENLVATVAGRLRDELRRVLAENRPTEVRFDLGAVDMVDSSGIGLLVAVYNTLKKSGGVLRVVNVRPEIYECLTIIRLNRIFAIEKQPEEG